MGTVPGHDGGTGGGLPARQKKETTTDSSDSSDSSCGTEVCCNCCVLLHSAGELSVQLILVAVLQTRQDFSPNRKPLYFDGADILDGREHIGTHQNTSEHIRFIVLS